MRRIIFITMFIFFSANPLSFAGEKISVKNYYTAPFGSYQTIRLFPRDELTGNCQVGTIYSDKNKNNGDIRFCLDSGNGTGTWGNVPGQWNKVSNNLIMSSSLSDPNLLIGIGTLTPDMKITLEGDGGILTRGLVTEATNSTASTLISSGAGTRFIWYPKKGASLAGTVDGTQWDDANIGRYSVVAGGHNNSASGGTATILGGQANLASDNFATVSGGFQNQAGGLATVVAGTLNQATGTLSFIGGGAANSATALNSSVCGGGWNTASNDYSTICGAATAHATGLYSTICGGDGRDGTIANPMRLVASGESSTIAGGNHNRATGLGSFVGGGSNNFSSGISSTICGGGARGPIDGAGNNTDTVGGNIASGNFSTVGGGHKNTASGNYSAVGGGDTNIASGDYSVIPGGRNNIAAGDYSFAGGMNMQLSAAADRTFAWGYSANPVAITTADAFIIYSGRVGIGTVNPTEKLEVNGNMRMTGSLTISTVPIVSTGANNPLKVLANGTVGLDLAEKFDTTEPVEVGDVLVIDDTQNLKLKKSLVPNDVKVAGIASGSPAIMFSDDKLQLSPAPHSFVKGTEVPVALAGRVPCKVSNENGPIHVGDSLTTSAVPGHAMKANVDAARGSIVGMALEPFTAAANGEKTGTIVVFVSLQ